jgi:hypothetical protein
MVAVPGRSPGTAPFSGSATLAAAMDTEARRALLARHAPIVRFDSRELFLPIAVDGYLAASTLHGPDGSELAAGDGVEAAIDRTLPEHSYVQFVAETERRAVVREEAKRVARRLFGPRLGRVGLFGRVLDALFLLSVFVRPTTPRLTTVAAALKVERLGLQRRPVVYARVVDVAGWLVLHYAWFYAMNDWRSSYRGLNDHEADWEQAWILCDPADRRPIWVVASNHDNRGPDLRRHWDDDECRRVGDRPVLYAGAGSHALYFRPGDYVSRVDVPGLRWLLRLQRWSRGALRIRDQAAERGLGPALGVPFVDAATGDGREIGTWDIEPLDGDRPALVGYRGLWGLDTGDPTNGERGPSGPKFDRDGKIRPSWADPVGFAGLHGTRPPSAAPLEAEVANLGRTLAHLDAEIVRTSNLLPLVQQSEAPATFDRESMRLSELLRQRAELEDRRARARSGEWVDPDIRAHLTNPATPLDPPAAAGWILALWAAASVPLLLLSVAALFLFDSLGVSTVPLAAAATFSLLEQLVRRHFQAVLRLLGIYLALGSVFVIVGALFSGVLTVSRLAIGAIAAVGALVLFVANLGELTAVQRRADAAAETGREG